MKPLALFGLAASLAVLAVATTAAPDAARAVAPRTCIPDPLGAATPFNLFVRRAYGASSTSVGGRVAVGGDATISSYAVGTGLAASSSRTDLIVGGGLTASGAQAPNGSVTYEGTLAGTISTPNGTLAQSPSQVDFDAEFSALESTSTAIAALDANGTATGPAYAFVLTGTDPTANVFSIAASALQQAQVIDIHVPLGSSTVVNVTGGSYSSAAYPTASMQFWNGSSYVQPGESPPAEVGALRSRLLWNFPTATTVQIGPNLAWQGTILAPRAAVSFPAGTHLYGTLIAASLANGNGTASSETYTGCVPASDADDRTTTGVTTTTGETTTTGPSTGCTSASSSTGTPAADVTQLTSTLPTLSPGQTAWVSTLWKGACVDATAFELTASGPPGITISYPTNTGSYSSLYKESTLLADDTDYASLKIAVGDDVVGDQAIALTVSYTLASAGGSKTRHVSVTLPVVAHSGPAIRQVTTALGPVAAGSNDWLDVAYTADAPGVTGATLTVSPPAGASVTYPNQGTSTSFSAGKDLAVGETDHASFRFDTGSLAPGTYTLALDLEYGSGSHLSGTVTVVVK